MLWKIWTSYKKLLTSYENVMKKSWKIWKSYKYNIRSGSDYMCTYYWSTTYRGSIWHVTLALMWRGCRWWAATCWASTMGSCASTPRNRHQIQPARPKAVDPALAYGTGHSLTQLFLCLDATCTDSVKSLSSLAMQTRMAIRSPCGRSWWQDGSWAPINGRIAKLSADMELIWAR